MSNPWPLEKRASTKIKIDREARRAAARLGASHVMIVAFFADGQQQHMLDGGTAPMDIKRVYEMMTSAHDMMQESGGKDVAIS